jgi:RHS repeat-associated protein
VNVFFDNLQVVHRRGPILEETHYYPFGLTMNGISSKALSFGNPENKKNKFQNQELNQDLGLNYYEFKYRNHDPQIGRFIQIDPLSDKYVYNSTYAFSENQVTGHVELEGLEKFSVQDLWSSAGITSSTDPKQFVKDVGKETLKPSTWAEASAVVGQIAAGALLGILTEGVGSGTIVTAETRALNSVRATTIEAGEVSLAQRATEIQGTLPVRTQNATTTAVASATTAEGQSTTLIGFSENNLRPVQAAALKPGEVAVSGAGHAEVTILNHAQANGMTVIAVAASRPICPGCATAISNAGAVPASPLKIVKPPVVDATYVKPPVVLPAK